MSFFKWRLVVAMTRTSTRDGLAAADPLELTFLEHPQQFGLRFKRHFADFVQQQGSAVSQLEAAFAPPVGPGESTLFMSE